ncbi:MAG: TIGR04086 family membrane protein [Lachnospiraceae bacterium]
MEASKPRVLIRSLLFSYILTGILLLVLAFTLYKLRLKEGQVTMAVNLIYIVTCFLGGLIIGKAAGRNRFLWGMLLGLSYFGVLFAVSLLMNRGLSGNMTQILTTMGVCAGSGTIGGMLS